MSYFCQNVRLFVAVTIDVVGVVNRCEYFVVFCLNRVSNFF
jgi:hypothetical protein